MEKLRLEVSTFHPMLCEMEVPFRGSCDGRGGQEVLGVAGPPCPALLLHFLTGHRTTYPDCWQGQLWMPEALGVYTAPVLMAISPFPFIPSLLLGCHLLVLDQRFSDFTVGEIHRESIL